MSSVTRTHLRYTIKLGLERLWLGVDPSIHRHEIRNKAWNSTLKQRIIPNDNALGKNVNLISLCCHWNKKNLHFVFYIDRDEKLSYSLTLLFPVHIKIPKVTKTQWGGSQIICFRINPWIHGDKVTDKAWYRAFKEGVIAKNNALAQDVNLVSLAWNWNMRERWLTDWNRNL